MACFSFVLDENENNTQQIIVECDESDSATRELNLSYRNISAVIYSGRSETSTHTHNVCSVDGN